MRISVGSVATIRSDRLNKHKCNEEWVPRILTPTMKEVRVTCCRGFWIFFDDATVDFCNRILTGDETRIHHYDPLTQHESKVWKRPSSPTPHRPRLRTPAGKIMLSVFFGKPSFSTSFFTGRRSRETITRACFPNFARRSRTNGEGI